MRKLRLKGGAGKFVNNTARVELAASTRYTILSDLEDDEDARSSEEEDIVVLEVEEFEEEVLEVKRERIVEMKRRGSPRKSRTTPVRSITDSPRTTKRGSPKKSPVTSSPDKRKQTTLDQTAFTPTMRRRHVVEEQPKLDTPRRSRKPKASALRRWFSWMRVLQIAVLLAVLYLITML